MGTMISGDCLVGPYARAAGGNRRCGNRCCSTRLPCSGTRQVDLGSAFQDEREDRAGVLSCEFSKEKRPNQAQTVS